MIRVAHVCPSISRTGGGVSESVRLLSKAVGAKDGIEARTFSLHDEHSAADVASWDGAPPSLFSPWPPRRFSYSHSLYRALAEYDPDVIHVHGIWMGHCLAVHLWASRAHKPYIISPHGMLQPWIRKRSKFLKSMVSLAFHDNFLRNATKFHVLTEVERQDVAEYATRDRVSVIPNYVDPFLSDCQRPTWWRSEYGNRVLFLYLGRIHEKKGCLELCEAWDKLSSSSELFRTQGQLIIAGWSDGLSGFDKAIERLRVKYSNAEFVGPQYGEEKTRTLSAASFFILPSKSEGLPMSVIESWSAGVPALLTPECNLPVGYSSGAAFRLSSDTYGIAKGIERAFNLSSQERSIASAASLEIAKAKFAIENVRVDLADLYHSAVSSVRVGD
ncbi:glycosyltransferase [Oceanicaulis sp.]|uniref:glycosyltransferase n=1 Tax=Oceanicaulis sp. TaxID=1924941 RepID=UPI003BAA2D2B